MKYLLVGNGPTHHLASASESADIIVQINDCRHAASLDPSKTKFVFIVNMGHTVSTGICDRLLQRQSLLHEAKIVLTRNAMFYAAKKAWLRARNWKLDFEDYHLTSAWEALKPHWPIKPLGFVGAVRLERKMLQLGMHPHAMPSTGMIAHDWLRRRLKPGDTLVVDGFTFEGWHGHPWLIESGLVHNIEPV